MNDKDIHILLVEDSAGDARLIREMLLESPRYYIQLKHVTTLQEGISAVQESIFDIILLDLSLPDSFGIETLRSMLQKSKDTAIVVLTGDGTEESGVQAVQEGAQDYLPKMEVNSNLLMRSINYAIERNRADIALRESEAEYRSIIYDVFDTSMVAVLILDKHFRVAWCNEATETYFGVSRERLLGQDKRILIDEELKCIFSDPDDYSTRLLQAYEDELFTDRFECHVLPDDVRQNRWLEHWSQPIRDGKFEGGRIEQYTDITDRKVLEDAEKQQRLYAEALRDIFAVITSTLNLNSVVRRILDSLDHVIPHDDAWIAIIEDDNVWVARSHNVNGIRETQDIVSEKQLQEEYRPYLRKMYQSGQPVIVDDLSLDSLSTLSTITGAYLGAPIQLQDEVSGFINVFSTQSNFYDEDHAERLKAFAELCAIAIQNARLYAQSQELAMVEERQRLARELHDSVSQTLFICRTMAESALNRWIKDPDRARELMEEVHQLTVTALAEMRILLLELRPTALTQISLKQLFEQYLKPIQDRRQFVLHLTLDDISSLPPDVQIAFYRITQEALNNIDKHAGATAVEICASEYTDHIELEIKDDGAGFRVDEVAATSLGLNIMRERSEKIKAKLTIESDIGRGTLIRVIWNKIESE